MANFTFLSKFRSANRKSLSTQKAWREINPTKEIPIRAIIDFMVCLLIGLPHLFFAKIRSGIFISPDLTLLNLGMSLNIISHLKMIVIGFGYNPTLKKELLYLQQKLFLNTQNR
jgi:hypothetical protein